MFRRGLCRDAVWAKEGCPSGLPQGLALVPRKTGNHIDSHLRGGSGLCSDRQLAGDLVEPWQATSLVSRGSQRARGWLGRA